MIQKFAFILAISTLAVPYATSQDVHSERSVYLNGIDISSARNQKLRGVDVHIDENGNIFFTAPHYDVLEEGSYVPLSKWSKKLGTSEMHKAPAELHRGVLPAPPSSRPSGEGNADAPENKELESPAANPDNGTIEKPGTDWPNADPKEI